MNKNMLTKNRVLSPLQLARGRSFQVHREEHPAREMIKKLSGVYNLTATIEEDAQTLTAMKHVDGLISFLCTLTLTEEGRVISQGRGSSVLSPNNRFITRSINLAFNSSLADAVIRATKVLDTFRTNAEELGASVALGEAYRAPQGEESQPATDKQKAYLRQLLSLNVEDGGEREKLE